MAYVPQVPEGALGSEQETRERAIRTKMGEGGDEHVLAGDCKNVYNVHRCCNPVEQSLLHSNHGWEKAIPLRMST